MRLGTGGPPAESAPARLSHARRSFNAAALLTPLLPALTLFTQPVAATSRTSGKQDPAAEAFLGPYFPYARLATLPANTLRVCDAILRVRTAGRSNALSTQELLTWVDTRARAIAAYFTTLPGSPIDLLFVFVDGAGVKGGSSWGHRGAVTRVLIGRDSTSFHIANDWILVHELVHHAMPSVPPRHHWMEEGLATYVEPVIRVQSGLMSSQTYWWELVAGLPKGLPVAGDAGLDNTPTWGRIYWGGALFYFLADLQARQRTGNRKGLRDALVALQRAGGNITQSWSPRRVFDTLDAALDAPVFAPLYTSMRAAPQPVDLGDLWRQLGVIHQDGSIAFDDDAPLAHVRHAMAGAEEIPSND